MSEEKRYGAYGDFSGSTAREVLAEAGPYPVFRDHQLANDLILAQARIAQLKRDMQAERDGNALLRRKHGAHEDETMAMFVARLSHGHREWGKIMEALRNFHRGPCRDVMPSCDTCSGLGYVVP